MNKQYIDACENFKWLQEELGGGRGDQCKCEIKKEKGKHCMLWWAVPRLDTLIELLGEDFISLQLRLGWEGEKEWHCLSNVKGVVVCNVADTPELACLMALKKVWEAK